MPALAAVVIGGGLIAGGVLLATRKSAGGTVVKSPGEATTDVPKVDPEVQAVADAGETVSVGQVLAPGETTTTPSGTAVTKSPEGFATLIEPGFTIEKQDGTHECSDANGGAISCDDLAARIKREVRLGSAGGGGDVVF